MSEVSDAVSKNETDSFFKKGFEVLPDLKSADSLQILYYDDPYGDPKRYARFFKFVSSSDSSSLHLLLENLNQTFTVKQHVTTCHSEGKIYLFKKSDPIKTVYFSSKKDSCAYLYFIKDGLFYEFSLAENAERMLAEQKKSARIPTPKTIEELQ